MTLNIKIFCNPSEKRKIAQEPFTCGDFSYATNGHICVKVDKQSDIDEKDFLKEMTLLFKEFTSENMVEFDVDIPTTKTESCKHCGGSGEGDCDCPTCQCECISCKGTGYNVEKISIQIGETAFDARYIRLIKSLPGIKISPSKEKPSSFIFDGGCGILMPIRGTFEKNIIASFKAV